MLSGVIAPVACPMASLTEQDLKYNGITHQSDGLFYCKLCWKYPSDMDRVNQHLQSKQHTQKMRIKKYYDNPLDFVPIEQHQWTVITNATATCILCQKTMVETHWNSALHLKRVKWEMSQQQQKSSSEVASFSSQSYTYGKWDMWQQEHSRSASPSCQSYTSGATTQSSSPVENCQQLPVKATLPHVENCQHEMNSPPLPPVPPPLPPVPPSPRQRSSGSGSAAYGPVLGSQPCDAWQSSATLSGMRGQQREKCLSNDEGLKMGNDDSCIAREVPDTCLAACRPAADQTPCKETPLLEEDGREIYYVWASMRETVMSCCLVMHHPQFHLCTGTFA